VKSTKQFKGIWIPAHIWEELDLTCQERCLWAQIDIFTGEGSGYYKTNEQASEELGISPRQVSRAFAKLETMGLITVEKSGVRRYARSSPWRGVHDSEASNTRQGGEVSTPQGRGIKNSEKHSVKHSETPLVMPFEGEEFLELWQLWCTERKKYERAHYSDYAQQKALNKLNRLSYGDISVAKSIIDQSIENAWKGFFPIRKQRGGGERKPLDAAKALEWASK
tara:strand:+ start:1316 stop:1984 length:669 start_codon:yes stop_codon:yes gene_type:complete